MTNQKSTKRALLTSVLALLVCVTMLIGSTFAWFTDTVSSGRNTIQSGNLDAVVEYYDAENDIWNAVESTTVLFDEDNWEPGHTKAVALKVSNIGTLAFKYNLAANIYNEKSSVNVYGDEFKLSDYLEVKAIAMDGGAIGDALVKYYIGSRDAAKALPASAFGADIANNAVLLAGKEGYVVIAITMPEETGNEANYKTGYAAPSIEFGIDLVATQTTEEKDTFGADYDKDATYPELPKAAATDLGTIAVPDADGKLTLADGSEMTIINNAYSSYSKANPTALDEAYVLSALETPEEAEKSPYRYWNADFVVTFDKDLIPTDATGVVGNYGNWGWIGFDAADFSVLTANTEYRLLASEGIYMNYYELCRDVQNFICGAFDDGTNAGTCMTIEVRLYETEDYVTGNNSHNVETGAYKTAATIDYVF